MMRNSFFILSLLGCFLAGAGLTLAFMLGQNSAKRASAPATNIEAPVTEDKGPRLVRAGATGSSAQQDNQAPAVEIGSDLEVELSQGANLEAAIEDDGLPAQGLQLIWRQLSGPGLVSFSNFTGPATHATFSAAGEYRLELEVSDGDLVSRDVLKVIVSADRPVEADYYVSTDGSDDNDGSFERPFRTIRKAASRVKPGDVVFIRGGIYKEYLRADAWVTPGEEENPITIAGYPGETAILDGSDRHWSDDNDSPSSPQLILHYQDWYVFENLTLRNSAGRGMDLRSSHNVVRNLVAYDNHGDGVHVKGSHNLIEDITSHGNYSEQNGGDSSDGLKIDSGDGNIVRRVLAYDNSDDGIDIWATTNTLVEYSIAHSNGYGTTGNGVGFKLSSREQADSGNIARFNISYNNSYINYSNNEGGGLELYNNTSWASQGYGFAARAQRNRQVNILRNNISFEDALSNLIDIQQQGGLSPDSANNSWDLGIQNPNFVSLKDSSERFLSLAANSPAIDAGKDIGLPYLGAAPDLGAQEARQ